MEVRPWILVWGFRGWIAYGFGETVRLFHLASVHQCNPDRYVRKWDMLLPVVIICALGALGAAWLVGFVGKKIERTWLWILAQIGITSVMFIGYVFAGMLLLVMTLCQ